MRAASPCRSGMVSALAKPHKAITADWGAMTCMTLGLIMTLHSLAGRRRIINDI